jgi:hypothetical protein
MVEMDWVLDLLFLNAWEGDFGVFLTGNYFLDS